MIRAPAEGQLGPAMRALLDRQQRFVIALLEIGTDNHTRAAAIAGYSATSHGSLRVTAHRLAHDSKIQLAIQEEAGRRMKAGAIMAASVLLEIANNPLHKDRLKAAEMLLNRSGLHAQTEHKVTVEHTADDATMLKRIHVLATSMGLDPQKLLGSAGVNLPVIDAEFSEVPASSTEGIEDLL